MNETSNKIKIEGSAWKIQINVDGAEVWRLAYPTGGGFKPVLEDNEELFADGDLLTIKTKKGIK